MKISLLGPDESDLHVQAVRALNQFDISVERSRELLAEPTYFFVAATDDMGEVMGRLYGHVLHRYGQTDLLLYEVDVVDKHQRKGVGKAMIEHARAISAQRGYNEMWVLTEDDNIAARALYANSGGVFEGTPVMYVFSLPERS